MRKETILIGGPCSFRNHAQIRIIGNEADRTAAENAIKTINLQTLPEGKARMEIQRLIVEQNLKAAIIYDGNSIWNPKPILQNLAQIMKHGTLYDGEKPGYVQVGSMLRFPRVGKCILSNYFYEFLHLHCGSIAHYNKQGWVTEYPTLEALKEFFKKNEYGQPVLESIPEWETDVKAIVESILERLYPLQAYVKSH